MTKDDIVATLPKLNEKELQEVIALAISLLNKEADDSTAELWFSAICAETGSQQSYESIKKGSIGSFLRDQADSAEALINELLDPASSTVTTQMAIRRSLIGLLIADLKSRNLPVTRGMLAKHMARLAEVLDHAFPDYRKNGMAPLLGKQLLGG